MTERRTDAFLVEDGSTIHGWKIAEVRHNHTAIMAVACDAKECGTLHFHILVEDTDGVLHFVTTFCATGDAAIMRSGVLFRALSMLVYGNLDLENVTPGEQAPPEPRKKVMDIIPGLTPWGKA